MRVRVRLFAMQRELAGTREVPLELPAGATIEDAWAALVAIASRSSRRAGRPSGSRVNTEYAERTRRSATATSSR